MPKDHLTTAIKLLAKMKLVVQEHYNITEAYPYFTTDRLLIFGLQ